MRIKKKKPLNLTETSIKANIKYILDGLMLSIDPSTGSTSSKPGFAVYDKGRLIESGIIDLDITGNRSLRLYEISRTIREDFSNYKFDILAVEYIPPVRYKGKGISINSVMHLQKSIGAILGALPFENLIEIPANVWHKFTDKDYVKSDEADAVMIGNAAVLIATKILEEDL